ncbi:hypothetical protein [Streptomyces cyslabdanicus]|uniref:hypothetical protein n=1 Tax=Streptomyces cyslabdanicus TaxID=1470456 RepID=UPI004043BCF2
MRHTQPPSHSAAVATAAALLALGPAAGTADAAGTGISVSANGSTVTVTTSVCSQVNGRWGTASLLAGNQTNFTQGRQVALTGTAGGQAAAWQSVSPGTYTVAVVCANNITAGTQSINVTGGRVGPTVAPNVAPNVVPPNTPNIAPTAAPTRGVLGGLGGGVKDYGTLTLTVGGTLVGAAVVATGWALRRRSRPQRF